MAIHGHDFEADLMMLVFWPRKAAGEVKDAEDKLTAFTNGALAAYTEVLYKLWPQGYKFHMGVPI